MSHHGRSGDQKTTVCVGRPHTCRGGRGGNHRVKGWCVKKHLSPRLALRWVLNTGEAPRGGEPR